MMNNIWYIIHVEQDGERFIAAKARSKRMAYILAQILAPLYDKVDIG